jgi:glutamate synthase (ferredoxin)
VQERDACGVGIIAELNGAASHKVVTKALRALGCMEHRGGCSADNDSGDGAGIMMQVPWKVLAEWAEGAKLEYTQKHTGVAQVFLPNDAKAAEQAQAIFNKVTLSNPSTGVHVARLHFRLRQR